MLRRVIVRALIVGLAVIAGGLFMVDWDDLLLLSPIQRTDDAYLRGDPTTLSARVPGYVRRVAVTDMETVKAGQVLYEIDDDEYRARGRPVRDIRHRRSRTGPDLPSPFPCQSRRPGARNRARARLASSGRPGDRRHRSAGLG